MSHNAAGLDTVAAATSRHRRHFALPAATPQRLYLASLVILVVLFVAFLKSNQASFQMLLSRPSLPAAALPQVPNSSRAVSVPRGQNDSYVSMCIAVKDEHCDIREWILYHASIGAGKFYLFDTESSPPMRRVLEDLIDAGLVEYEFMTNKSLPGYPNFRVAPGNSLNWQSPVFRTCLKRYRRRHRWMAFIDADEFIVLKDGVSSLPDLLKRHESHPGLVLHWRFFSFNGHIDRPRQGVLSSYTACCRRKYTPHRTIKSIVQPRLTIGPKTTHNFRYKKGHAVNTAGTRVDETLVSSTEEVSFDQAVLQHYGTKSLFDFSLKMKRRGGAGGQKTLEYFLQWHRACNESCTEAVPLGQQLAERYDLTKGVPSSCMAAVSRKPP